VVITIRSFELTSLIEGIDRILDFKCRMDSTKALGFWPADELLEDGILAAVTAGVATAWIMIQNY
jgi:hypothetical protein